MAGFVSRWQVMREHTVSTDDVDADGFVCTHVVEGWVAAARDAYLDRCVLVREICGSGGLDLAHEIGAMPAGAALGRPASVAVSASATEIHPESFTIAVRIRPLGGDRDAPVHVRCIVRVWHPETGAVHPIGDDLRDALIALEHAAEHFN